MITQEQHDYIVDFYNTVKNLPNERFIPRLLYDPLSKNHCIIGGYLKEKSKREDIGLLKGGHFLEVGGSNIWRITAKIYKMLHPEDEESDVNIADINNNPSHNGYKHMSIKDRGICFLEDYLVSTGDLMKEDRLVPHHQN